MTADQEPRRNIPRTPMTPGEIDAAHVGPATRLDGRVTLAEPDPLWPVVYATEAERIGTALAALPHRLEHVGSTSVPGLPAKPVVDILLAVPDSAAESTYVPALEGLGYGLVVREPDWYEHRVLRHPAVAPGIDYVNLHVFTSGCPEIDRMTGFRDRLRTHPADRALYARTKRELSGRTWEYVQNYADAKSEVVEEILRRAGRG
ncbi:GrpB family protein [Streptomyces sp. HUAS MG91]|uniref:GrpB family protein n=1 Tax=Streptomyces tabacisoli TaxID=3156398 RepID=UPI00338DA2BF